jgi:hypothetical protein
MESVMAQPIGSYIRELHLGIIAKQPTPEMRADFAQISHDAGCITDEDLAHFKGERAA